MPIDGGVLNMSKSVPISVVDALLDKIATANLQVACFDEPKSRDDAVTTFSLAQASLTSADFTKETVDDKRSLLIETKTAVSVDTSGQISHIALCDATSLIAVTTANDEYLSSDGQYSFPEWVINVSVA